SATYFQSYQLAYDIALKAQKCFNNELGFYDSDSKQFLQFGTWDSLKKGLLTGELLQFDLRRMELDYLEQNKREFELIKHVSIAQLNPAALLMLKQTGSCDIELVEPLFDLDYAGHHFRRIKSVSLSIPCIVGPYTSVNCTLQLKSNKIRINTNLDTLELNQNVIPVNNIATSSAQNDSGVFELNFRDERYLPFEGAGVISSWKLELPDPKIAQFNYNSISDIIMHVKYTARCGGENLKTAALNRLTKNINSIVKDGLIRVFNLKNDFPSEYHELLNPKNGEAQKTTIKIEQNHLPYFLQGKTVTVSKVEVYLKAKDDMIVSIPTVFKIHDILTSSWKALSEAPENTSIRTASAAVSGTLLGDWTIDTGMNGLNKNALDNIFIAIAYTVTT
ncbi:MAG: hypothetical protein JWN78_1407, partial [Bacteroidota bacterium]|nr:hypothetical protein [Bacteroidota bacterium]